jgi:hypothetical protein
MRLTYQKLTIPVKIEEIKRDLEKAFPEYEVTLYGAIGKGIRVKDNSSMFKGLRVVKASNVVRVLPRPVSLLPRLIDSILFGALSRNASRDMTAKVLDFIQDRYQ